MTTTETGTGLLRGRVLDVEIWPPRRLPATIEEHHLRLPVLWPSHGTWPLYLLEGATDFAVDAEQVLEYLGYERVREDAARELLRDFPLSFWHRESTPHGERDVLLWSREAAASFASMRSPRTYVSAASRRADLLAWLAAQHEGICGRPQLVLDEALPLRRSAGGTDEEFPIGAAVRRLQVRFGPEVSRQLVVDLMLEDGWVQRVPEYEGRGELRTTIAGRAKGTVFSRSVATPRGSYEQVFVTQAGLAALSARMPATVEVPLVEIEDVR